MILSGGQTFDFAPQALAETSPLYSHAYIYANDGLDLSGKHSTYAALYRAQPSIATLVDKVANAAARLSVKVWDSSLVTGKVQELTSPYAQLINNPCSLMSPFNFWRWTVSTYEIYGEAFWLKLRHPDGHVVSLFPMHPSRVAVERDDEGAVVYVFSLGVASAGLLRAPAADVVPFLRYSPDTFMRGMSRLEPLRSTLLNEDAARRATASWWQRGARPSVALKHPGELSEGAQQRLLAAWESRHSGADLMGGTAILEEGMEAQIIQLSAEEMQYVESRKLNLQEACMVYDVPPPVVHILDHATFSNITEQMRSMYRDTMAPRLEDLESTIDFYLRPEFYPDSSRRAVFALDEVLRGDFETRAVAVGSLIEKGVFMPSEARLLFDLPQAGPEADVLYGNAALVPLGSSVHGQQEVDSSGNLIPSPMPQGSPHPPTVAAPVKRLVLSPLMRAVLGRVGQVKAVGGTPADVKGVLVDEHRKALDTYFTAQRAAPTALADTTWDDQLATLLSDLGLATAKSIGGAVAASMGGQYDVGEIADWIHENAITSAAAINATTLANLKAYLDGNDEPDAVDGYFDGQVAARGESISLSRVAVVGGLAALSSAAQNNGTTKTWLVTAHNPRPSHAQMNGETVGIDETFSNGMNMPGDPAGGADEVAGCTCDVSFGTD